MKGALTSLTAVQLAAVGALISGSVIAATPQFAKPILADPVVGLNDPLTSSKHDFTGLNRRAGVRAMSGVAYSDYGNPCVYCHLPPSEATQNTGAIGGVEGWNRFKPATEHYQLYKSSSIDAQVKTPGSASLLCLSCHDGTMAIDMVMFKPNDFKSKADAALHMKLSGNNDLSSCGKCHDGRVAHDISPKVVGTDLKNDHPISLRYGGFNWKDPDFRLPEGQAGFNNGVKLYAGGDVECASCHNVHDTTNELLLTVRRDVLCDTCHTK